MAITGNKGEWSEIYVLFKLLGEKKVYAGDGNLNKIERIVYPILKILRDEQDAHYDYSVNDDIVIVSEDGTELLRKGIVEFLEASRTLLSIIRSSTGSFCAPSIEQFMSEIHCKTLKAKSGNKTDITIVIHDLRTGMTPTLGFSIKSQLGDNSTLFNASKTTNFTYEIQGHTFSVEEITTVNSIATKYKIGDRLKEIMRLGGTLHFVGIDDNICRNNFILIDSCLPQIMGDILLERFLSNRKRVKDLTEIVSGNNPIGYDMSYNQKYYEHKVKNFLVAAALGMMPHTPWNGTYEANGGYLVVKDDGEVLCYHFYDRNLFEDYLYYNTKLETPSSSRHQFGKIYVDENCQYFKLNLQIRFL